MFKNRYQFNPETLSYDKISLTTSQKITQVVLYLGAFAVIISSISFFIFTYFFNTADYQTLMNENKQWERQYKDLNKRMSEIERVLGDVQHRDDNIYRVMLEKDPIPASIREAGFGGTDRYNKLRGFDNSNLVIETTKRLDKISSKLNIQANSLEEIYSLAKRKSKELECIPALSPVSKKRCYISSFFGNRFHPILKRRKFHEGLDFAAPVGTKIYAPGDGVVKSVAFSGGYGRVIKIDHGFGYKTLYAHLYKVKVKVGDKVKRGQVIATIGNSGLSTGPHLHYEVLKDGKHVNPIHYYFGDLTPEEFNEMKILADNQKKTGK